MADQMRPTPRNSVLGLFSDIVNLPLQYMSAPERTQQMQGTAQFLYGTGIPKTLERMSYGDSLFSGAGMTLRPKEETINAAMNVAPFAPAVGRLASRAVRATEGLPVGMSIKDVGKSNINVSLNEASNFLSAKSEFGQVGGTIRPPDRFSDKPYLQINYAEVEKASRGQGKGKELYQSLIDEAQARGLRVFSDSTVEKPAVNVYKSLEKGGYKLRDMTTGSLEDGAVYGAGASKPAFEISAPQPSPYPQQAALDLAQQRAALPVEQGGLGLPANNTAADRAKAMGFDTPVYHATDVDFTEIRPSVKGKYGAGVYTATSPKYAEIYAQGENARTLPLMARGKIASDDERIAIADQMLEQYRTNQSMSVPLWKEKTKEELANRGYTGVGIGKERLMFNPEDLRSRFAAYDPFRKDVATATAMGVALPDLLAQPVNQYQPTYETTPIYTDPFGNTIGSSIR